MICPKCKQDDSQIEFPQLTDRRMSMTITYRIATIDDIDAVTKLSMLLYNGVYNKNAHSYDELYGSNKIKQIKDNSEVAVCGEWFVAHGIGENLGYVLDDKNKEIMSKLRTVFAEWYDNGHTNENDPKNTCGLRIRLTDAVLFSNGRKYEIDFSDGGKQDD